jgi:hypothetical protein
MYQVWSAQYEEFVRKSMQPPYRHRRLEQVVAADGGCNDWGLG